MSRSRVTTFAVVVGMIAAALGLASAPLAAAPNAPVAPNGPPPLFVPAATGDLPPNAAAAPRPEVVRSQLTRVNPGVLFDANGAPADRARLPRITLNLFPDATYVGIVDEARQDRWGSSWNGTLAGVSQGYFFVTVVDGVLMTHVASPQGVYEVSQAAGDLYRAVQIDQAKFRDHPDEWDPPVGTAVDVQPLATSVGATADTGATIDIMVAYTATARQAAGSTAAMESTIQTALNETNTAYANSGVTPRLRLVRTEEVSYTESGNISTDVSRLTGTTDGYMDNVHTLRNTYGADMVGLIVENGGGYCGVANTIAATAASAFQVTARNCTTGYYSFGHEFGHLQGARHDIYVDSSTSPYAYGHGYVNTSTDSTKRWRTVMAYNNRCSDLGYNCTRLIYWSNPNNTYLTQPMGVVGSSENYRVLNATASTVANFRAEVSSPTFAVSVSPTAGSVNVGASTSTAVSTSALSGTPPTLSLSATGLPTGVTASFSPTSVTAGSGSTLTLSAASGAAPGSYTVTVNATSDSTTVSTSFTLTVDLPNSFNDSFTNTVGNWSAVTGTWALNGSGQYQSSGLANAWSSVANSTQFADGTYQATMTRSGGTAGMGSGIILRGSPSSRTASGTWTPSYSFQYTNNRTFSVTKVDSSGTSTALKGWTSSRAIVKGGANTLKVVASGTSLQFSINGTLVWTGTDSLLSVGQVGVGFVRDGTSSTLRIDAASVTPA